MHFFKQLAQTVVNYLENSSNSLWYLILTFLFVITLRNGIELISDHTAIKFPVYLHYYASYGAMAVCFILLFYWGTRESIQNIIKVILPCFLVLISAPVLDLVISKGQGFDMNYFQPGFHDPLWLRFFTFFGPMQPMAVTPGMRIEIVGVIVATFYYFWIKTGRVFKSMLFSLLMYVVIFGFASILYGIVPTLYFFHLSMWPADLVLASVYFIMIFLGGAWIVYLANPNLFKIFLRDVPWERVAHYQLLMGLGLVLGAKLNSNAVDSYIIFPVILTFIGHLFACFYVLVINNLSDQAIDKLSNPDRALVSGKISFERYHSLQWVFLSIAILYGVAAGLESLFYLAIFMGGYFIYSIPPLRLKRVTYVSKYPIAFNSLISVMIGYQLMSGTLLHFPSLISLFFMTIFVLPIQFIDLKDVKGDRALGIRTLPVVLGERRAKIWIGISFVIAFLATYLILGKMVLIPILLTAGVFHYILINKSNYQDRHVFWAYLVALAGFIGMVILFGIHPVF